MNATLFTFFGGSVHPLRMWGACEPAANTAARHIQIETVVLGIYAFVYCTFRATRSWLWRTIINVCYYIDDDVFIR